jgi:transposase-like protein
MTKPIVPQVATSDNAFLGEPTDALRDLFAGAIHALMEQEVAARLGADHYERSEGRNGQRNGTRPRRFDTRMGSLHLQVPRIRNETYQPSFLTHRERCEAALACVIHEAYINGVSTRKVEKLAQALGIESLSKSQVSELNAQLDVLVTEFRERLLTLEYPYLMFDAIYEKIRINGRSQSQAAVIAYGIREDGVRELIGMELVDTESCESWSMFFRKLLQRGLKGVKLVISDAHAGLIKAIEQVLLGASWQRCKVHFFRNILAAVPQNAKSIVAADLKPLFHQAKREDALAIVTQLVDKYSGKHERAMQILVDGIDDALTYLDFPPEHAAKISSTNPIERMNREIRRRTRSVGVFPSVASAMRLIGMVLLEQTDEWETQRGYMSADSMKQIELMQLAT